MNNPLSNHDRRADPRETVNQRARVFYGPSRTMWADGQIVDLSTSGAKLMVPGLYPLSPRFLVLQIRGGVVFDVRLKWRRGDLAGLAIEGRREIEGSTDQVLIDLAPTWRALADIS